MTTEAQSFTLPDEDVEALHAALCAPSDEYDCEAAWEVTRAVVDLIGPIVRTAQAEALTRAAVMLVEVQEGRHMRSYSGDHAMTASIAIGACAQAILALRDEIEATQ